MLALCGVSVCVYMCLKVCIALYVGSRVRMLGSSFIPGHCRLGVAGVLALMASSRRRLQLLYLLLPLRWSWTLGFGCRCLLHLLLLLRRSCLLLLLLRWGP